MPQPFTVEDLYLHRKITSLHCVAAIARALCSVKSVDRDNDGYRTHLWQFPLDGSGGAPLRCSDGSDSSPRWSPQGDRLAFLSGRSGGATQVFVAPADGSEAEQLGSLSQSVMNLRWMPDGSGVVVTSAVTVDPDLHGRRSSRPPPVRKAGAPEVAWRLP